MAKKWPRHSWSFIGQFLQAHAPFSRHQAESSIEYFDRKFAKTAIRAKLADGWLIVAFRPATKRSGKHWAYKIYKKNQLVAFGVTHFKLKMVDRRGLIQRSHIEQLEDLLLETLKLHCLNSSSPVLHGTVILS